MYCIISFALPYRSNTRNSYEHVVKTLWAIKCKRTLFSAYVLLLHSDMKHIRTCIPTASMESSVVYIWYKRYNTWRHWSPVGDHSVPERHCQDLLHIDPPLQHLGHLPFLWSLFHFFSSDQVHRLWGQDQVPFNPLNTAENKRGRLLITNVLSVVWPHVYHTEADQPWSGGRIWWLCLQSRSSPSWPGTVAARADHPCPGSHLQSFC